MRRCRPRPRRRRRPRPAWWREARELVGRLLDVAILAVLAMLALTLFG